MTEEIETKLERISVPALDAILGKKFPVLNDGFIRLVDYMGNDGAVVQAARVSYGAGTKKISEDRNLIRYLMRHKHTTPFEMCEIKLHVRVPMDCWRQWIRHRTACLSGDTLLHFDLPGGIKRRGNQLYKMSVRDVYDKFKPTSNKTRPDKQKNPYHKRDRVQQILLRSMNEDTGEVQHTRIVDIWESGKKAVIWMSLKNGAKIKASHDHLFLTDQGWQKMSQIENRWLSDEEAPRIYTIGPKVGKVITLEFNLIDEETEEWKPVLGWETHYHISNQGRVKRIIGGKGSRSFGRCKKITARNDGRAVVSLNKPGEQKTCLVHQLVLKAFIGSPELGQEACHNNGNSLDNRLENLRWDSPESNIFDKVEHLDTTFLWSNLVEVIDFDEADSEMTYDIEVEGPFHNFSAEGIITHNSVNEYSTRYSEAIDSCQKTAEGEWRIQGKGNKQGSEGFLSVDIGKTLTRNESTIQNSARLIYEHRLEMGVAREQARKDLLLSTYTEAYWKIDLKNLLHFLGLRMDSHAQQEIRDYATVLGDEIVSLWVPEVYAAFNDYHTMRNAITLTAREIDIIQSLGVETQNADNGSGWHTQHIAAAFGWLNKTKAGRLKKNRERSECEQKMERLGLSFPW